MTAPRPEDFGAVPDSRPSLNPADFGAVPIAESPRPKKAEPSDVRVFLNATSKGIASIPDAILNAPQNVVNLGRAAVGSVANIAGRPDLAPDINQPPNYAHRALTALGAIGEGGEPVNSRQRIIDAMGQGAAGMAVNPARSGVDLVRNAAMGATAGGVSGLTTETTGSPLAGMAAGMATPFVANAVGNNARARVEQAMVRRGENAVNDRVLQEGRNAGYTVPVSETNRGSIINNILESIGGKAAVRQESSLRNQEITNRLASQELGLPPGTAITDSVLRGYREKVSAPYREVEKLPTLPAPRTTGIQGSYSAPYPLIGKTPQSAAEALRDLKQARYDATNKWIEYKRTGEVSALEDAKKLSSKVDSLETHLEKTASAANRPDLVEALKDARTKIAKSHDIERSLNIGNADVSAVDIGKMVDKTGQKMSDNLRLIGEFAQGPGAKFVQEGAKVQAPTVSATNAMYGTGLGIAGASALGPAGAAAAVIPFLRGPIRDMVLSPAYQRLMGTPSYGPSTATRAAANIQNLTPEQRMLESLLIARSQADAQGNR